VQTKTEAKTAKIPITFLSLPAELRNNIYRLSLIRGTFCIYTCAGRPWSTVLNLYCASQLPLSLLRVNRQVHSETAGILYGENNFAFPDPIRCTWDFRHWLEQIGPGNCRLSIEVNIFPPVSGFHNEMLAAFIECTRLLDGATDLDLILNKVNASGNCKKIAIQRVEGQWRWYGRN